MHIRVLVYRAFCFAGWGGAKRRPLRGTGLVGTNLGSVVVTGRAWRTRCGRRIGAPRLARPPRRLDCPRESRKKQDLKNGYLLHRTLLTDR